MSDVSDFDGPFEHRPAKPGSCCPGSGSSDCCKAVSIHPDMLAELRRDAEKWRGLIKAHKIIPALKEESSIVSNASIENGQAAIKRLKEIERRAEQELRMWHPTKDCPDCTERKNVLGRVLGDAVPSFEYDFKRIERLVEIEERARKELDLITKSQNIWFDTILDKQEKILKRVLGWDEPEWVEK